VKRRIKKKTEKGPEQVQIRSIICVFAVLALPGCAGLTQSSSLNLNQASPSSEVVVLVDSSPVPAPSPRRGFLGLFKGKPEPTETKSNETLLTEALINEGAEPVLRSQAAPSLTDDEIAARSIAATETSVASKPPRLFGFLKRSPTELPADPTPTEVMLAQPTSDVKPSMTDEEIAARSEPEIVEEEKRFKLFGGLRRQASEPDIDVPFAEEATAFAFPETPGFGAFAPACGIPKRSLGTEVARSPGDETYKLYDTAPSSSAPRLQYVTGFKDGCPRQFFAALALFGSPVVHETKRYDPSNKRGYTVADVAYEKVKGKVCRVERGQFCPEDKLGKLGRDVALLTAYPSFGGTGEWMDVVMFKGKVAGHSVEN